MTNEIRKENVFCHLVRLTWRGCGYLPGYGHHPGTIPLVVMILLGGLAGLSGGWHGAAAGTAIMAICFGGMYLVGAYGRARDYNLKNEVRKAAEKARSLKDVQKEEC